MDRRTALDLDGAPVTESSAARLIANRTGLVLE